MTDSGHPPGSPSATDSLSRSVGAKEVAPTPTSWSSNPAAMRDRERRSKSNADRPTKSRAEASLHFPQPDFSGDSSLHTGVVAALATPVARGLRSKAVPVTPVRKSTRGAGLTEQPVLDRAVSRAQDKDFISPGNSSSPDFAVLPSLSNEHLLKVVTDSFISFITTKCSPLETLSLIRAAELAQADLAQAWAAIAAKQEEDKLFAAREKEARDLSAASAGADPPQEVQVEGRGGPSTHPPQASRCFGPITRRRGLKKASPSKPTSKPYTRQARARKGVS